MFDRFKRTKTLDPLDNLINTCYITMLAMDVTTPEYQELHSTVKDLEELRANRSKTRFSPDAMLAVFGNLAGIVLIVVAERTHAMTSEGFKHLFRPQKP